MGRPIPVGQIKTIHQTLSIALTIVWIAALVATISGLCGLWPKKNSKSLSTKEESETKDIDEAQQQQKSALETTTTDDDQFSIPLPPPPSATKLEFGENTTGNMKPKLDKTSSLINYMSKTTSRRKLTSSISLRMSTKLKDKASEFKSEFKGKASELKDKASDLTDIRKKHEHHHNNETLWTKRIILGERCRLPNQDDEGVLYNGQGNNKVATAGSQIQLRSLSRSCSSIDHGAIAPVVNKRAEKVEEKVKGKEKVDDDYDSDDY